MTISTPTKPRATLVLVTSEGTEMQVAVDMVSAKDAGAALDFSAEILAQLRRYELIAGDGDMIDLDDAARVVDDLRAEIAPVAGQPILISEAVKKYGFTTRSIYRWIADGWIKIIVAEPKQMVDEGDIALAKALANRRGHIPGRSVFPAKPRSGRPKKRR